MARAKNAFNADDFCIITELSAFCFDKTYVRKEG
jgi:hypothetical protein